jgi:hypothetical protein
VLRSVNMWLENATRSNGLPAIYRDARLLPHYLRRSVA